MKSRLPTVLIALAGLALLVSCAPVPVSQAPMAAQAPVVAGPTGTLTIGVPVIIDTLDPTMSNNVNIENVGLTALEGLTYLNANNEVEPMLAESWEIPDDTTYIFHLRKGITFHNGEPFNADSVIFTEKWVKETKRGAQYPWETVKSIEKVDDYTVKIITKAPDPLFLKRMGVAAGSLYPPKYVQEVGDEGVTQKPVGTGPFMFKEWVRGEKVIFEANPSYWGGPGVAQVGTVVWKNIPEADTRIAALETGEIDIALQVPAAQVGVLMDNPKLKVSRALSTRVFYMMFDNISSGKGTPIEDKRVRQAMIHAVDRWAIIEAIFRGNGEVINSLVGNVQFGYDPSVPPLPYDPAKAKALLAEAGYPRWLQDRHVMPQRRLRQRRGGVPGHRRLPEGRGHRGGPADHRCQSLLGPVAEPPACARWPSTARGIASAIRKWPCSP